MYNTFDSYKSSEIFWSHCVLPALLAWRTSTHRATLQSTLGFETNAFFCVNPAIAAAQPCDLTRFYLMLIFFVLSNLTESHYIKVHLFWEGHEFLRNIHCRFVLCSNGQIHDGDFAKFCELLRIYEFYIGMCP